MVFPVFSSVSVAQARYLSMNSGKIVVAIMSDLVYGSLMF